MKRLSGLLAALILTGACAGVAVRPSPVSTIVTSPGVATTPPEIGSMPEITTTVPAGAPVAWIAPSGVPLAITAIDGETIEVLTPCGNSATITDGTPVYDVDVVIDPGHGGPIDTGAVGVNGLTEKEINLEVSREVQDLLTSRGISSMLTRVADYPITIPTRATYSELVGARAIVSIHHNAPMTDPSSIPGVEVFVQSDRPESARLGGLIYDRAMASLGTFDVEWVRAPDAGVMTVLNSDGEDAYGMVRRPMAPSALAELGYIANPAEAELYTNPRYVPTIATAVADAVDTFLNTDGQGSPLVEGRDFNPAGGVGQDECIEPDLELP
jgi:N-acetylmuramoyl-L-alanine amidase